LGLGLGLGALRTGYLQVLKAKELRLRSQKNFLREVPVPSVRGRLLDRQGRVLAQWDGSVDVLALFGEELKVDSAQMRQLEKILGGRVSLRKNYLGYDFVAKDIPPEKAHAVAASLYRYPWLLMVPGKGRKYLCGQALSHVVGYVDADGIGRAGAERAFDGLLAGEPGKRYMVVDALGRVVQEGHVFPKDAAGFGFRAFKEEQAGPGAFLVVARRPGEPPRHVGQAERRVKRMQMGLHNGREGSLTFPGQRQPAGVPGIPEPAPSPGIQRCGLCGVGLHQVQGPGSMPGRCR